MSLGDNIRSRRQALKLSQGYVADQLGVSRQAVCKWESGQSAPSAANLADLAMLLETSVSDLVSPQDSAVRQIVCEEVRAEKKTNEILRLNLSMLAIALQAGSLYACTQIPYVVVDGREVVDYGFMLFKIAILFICSCWMARNLAYEENVEQRKKNGRIELLYCCVQLGIALITAHFEIHALAGLSPTVAVALFYILYINPKYMNRPFGRKQAAQVNQR